MSLEKIVIATGNAGKLRELQEMLSGLGIEVVSQQDFNVPDAAETGMTFVENAILKARQACRYTGLPALADDSGLEVDALRGAPGIYSARFAGENATDADNNRKLVTALSAIGGERFPARYQCVIVLLKHELDPTPLIAQGTWEGEIVLAPRGDKGFGYDPHFLVPEKNRTAAELSPEVKNAMSHRGQALKRLLAELKAQRSR